MEIHLLALLMIKHAVADLFLQSFHKDVNKLKYVSNAHRHYIEHGVLTAIVSAFFVAPQYALVAGFLDYIAHWHIDYSKSRLVVHFGINRDSTTFWRVQAGDQALHYLTYYLICVAYLQYVV